LTALFVLGCAAGAPAWQRPKPTVVPSELPRLATAQGPGKWMLLPDYAGADFVQDDSDGSRRLITSGLRVVRGSDGSIQHSDDFMAVDGARAIELPPRVGGGVLFLGERNGETLLWRASSWTSPLVPLSRVSERVEQIVVGFDRLYLELPLVPRWVAVDLDDGKVLDLEPLPPAPGYSSLAFADGWLGAVSTDVLGVLVTFDAGASWHPLPGVDRRSLVSAERGDLLLATDQEQFRLTADGRLHRQASRTGAELFQELSEARFGPAPERDELSSVATQPPLSSALRDAVLYGWPTRDAHALVMTSGSLARVRSSDGRVERFTPNVYPGDKPCTAVPLGDGLGFVCNQSPRGTTLYRFVAPFGVEPVRRFEHTRVVRSSGNGALVISGDCDEAAVERDATYCLLRRDGEPDTLRVRGDAGVERVAILSDGSVAVLVPPRLGNPGSLTLIRGTQQSTVPLVLPEEDAAFLETGLWLEPLVEVGEQALGTWVSGSKAYRGVTIDLHGKVRSHAPAQGASTSRTVFNGAIAFEVTPSGLVFTSTDFGKNWSRLDAPPALYPLDQRTALSTLGPLPTIGCSHVGCAYGPWLRLGFDTAGGDGEKPSENGEQSIASSLVEAEVPKRAQFNPTSYFDWHPSCYALGEAGPAPAELERRLERRASEHPRRGLVAGFLPPLLAAAPEELAPAVFRPFQGMKGPSVPKASVRFDEGQDDPHAFRAYAWAPSASQWTSNSAWQVWVSDPFGDDGVWATAPTFTPWPDAVTAAELFGAKERERGGADWTLDLDPDEQGGILRIGSGLSAELHVIGSGRAMQSFGTAPGGQLAGAVKVDGQWYYGQHDGDEFRIFTLTASGPELVVVLPVSSMQRATLVKSDDAASLGILVRTREGSWYLYPLDETHRPLWPLSVSREALNSAPVACGGDDPGWVVVEPLPLSRLDGAPDAAPIEFESELSSFRANHVVAKVRVLDGRVCLEELSAVLSHKGERERLPQRSRALPGDAIPLLLRDDFLQRQLHFRCSP
jgi:hypothetical protein